VPALRAVLLIVGTGLLAICLIAAVAGAPLVSLLWFATVGTVLIIGALFERGRYKPASSETPGPGWVATGESFIDPGSGEPVTVYYQPATGERRYVKR
jgi:hypothetical protein